MDFSSSRHWLQCGHDPKAVENSRVAVLEASPAKAASMRPRPEGRGEHHYSVRPLVSQVAASMRPRPEGRGEPFQQRTEPTKAEQGFNAATTRRPWRTRDSFVGASRRWTCFNAATTRRPWRTLGEQVDPPAEFGASMRPRPEGRGERLGPRRNGIVAVGVASMRPRPEGRGEPVQCRHFVGGIVASMRPRPEGRGEHERDG